MPKIVSTDEKILFLNQAGNDTLQSAVDQAMSSHKPLFIGPGNYPISGISISGNIEISAMPGSVTFQPSIATSFYVTIEPASTDRISDVTLRGFTFDGIDKPFSISSRPGLIRARNVDRLLIENCFIGRSTEAGIDLKSVAGKIRNNEFYDCRTAILTEDSAGLEISGNYIRDTKDNGIVVRRLSASYDGTIVSRNRILTVDNATGGSGEFGNAIFVVQASDVVIESNVTSGTKYSGIRLNTCSNSHIVANNIMTARETAIFVEAPDPSVPGYTGATVTGNVLDTAGRGICAVNPEYGGRQVVIANNVVRNVVANTFDQWASPDRNPNKKYNITTQATGITGEGADIVIAGNVVEGCQGPGIIVTPLGSYNSAAGQVRDQNSVAIIATNNIVKNAPISIGYSDHDYRGYAEISENVAIGATNGAVVKVQATSISSPLFPAGNNFGPYARVSGSADMAGTTTPITDKISFSRNKSVPATG